MSNYEDLRLVISGVGGITPIGDAIKPELGSVDTAWDNAVAGKSGITSIEQTDIVNHPFHDDIPLNVAAGVKFDIKDHPSIQEVRRAARYWSRASLLAAVATRQALDSANFDPEAIDPYRISHYTGSVFGTNGYSHEIDLGRISPTDGTKNLFAQTGLGPSMHFGFKGRGSVQAVECASGAFAIESGVKDLLPQYYKGEFLPPKADMAVVGGTDATLVPVPLKIFVEAFQGATDTNANPEEVSIPFDTKAHGLVAGEGSTYMVIEPWERAKERGLTENDILAELVGWESFTDAKSIVLAGIEGQVRAMATALKMAKISIEQTVYINGHATSTAAGDAREALAVRELVRRMDLDPNKIFISSTKSLTGHTMGAAGAIELYITALAVKYGVVPQSAKMTETIPAAVAPAEELHFDKQDDLNELVTLPLPQLRGENFSPQKSTKTSLDIGLSNSFGFGGGAVALALKKFRA